MKTSKIVESGHVEPSEAEIAKKQAEILERLGRVTPDQLAEFRGRSLDTGRANETKLPWEKTIWEK